MTLQTASPAWFPSDLVLPSETRVPTHLAGRVTSLTATHLTLADAIASCDIELPLAGHLDPSPRPGDWVRLAVTTTPSPGGLRLQATHVEQHTPGLAVEDGQFQRLTRTGGATASVAANLIRRAEIIRRVRTFFDARRYVEVTTPSRVMAPGTDVYLEPEPCGQQWLITSPEFHLKRLVVGGMPRIYELARCARRDEIGPWHQPDFTMLEWYQAYCPFDALIEETEQLVRTLAAQLNVGPVITVQKQQLNLEQPFQRLTVREAFRQFAGVDDVSRLADTDEDEFFQLLVDRVEPALAQAEVPVFLTHYPISQAALAQPSAEFPGYAERFELFVGGVELCNGYGELTCPQTLHHRFTQDVVRRAAKGLPTLPIDEGLLAAMVEGLPPCSGNALGLDRLIALLCEQPLSQIVAFPAA